MSQTLYEHLESRHLDIALHRPVVDLEDDVVTFYLWNLSGAMVGFQRYRRFGSKKINNNPYDGKYFTYSKQPTLAVWGVESLHLTPNLVFVTEGVFDAARLTQLGYSAVAALSNHPTSDFRNWLNCLNRRVVVVADNDHAGKKLASFGHEAYFMTEKDLGDSSDEEVFKLLDKVLDQ